VQQQNQICTKRHDWDAELVEEVYHACPPTFEFYWTGCLSRPIIHTRCDVTGLLIKAHHPFAAKKVGLVDA